jgi:hypothetical protein
MFNEMVKQTVLSTIELMPSHKPHSSMCNAGMRGSLFRGHASVHYRAEKALLAWSRATSKGVGLPHNATLGIG